MCPHSLPEVPWLELACARGPCRCFWQCQEKLWPCVAVLWVAIPPLQSLLPWVCPQGSLVHLCPGGTDIPTGPGGHWQRRRRRRQGRKLPPIPRHTQVDSWCLLAQSRSNQQGAGGEKCSNPISAPCAWLRSALSFVSSKISDCSPRVWHSKRGKPHW